MTMIPDAAAQLFRRFAGRWYRFADVVHALHILEDGGRSKLGELARRTFHNSRHQQTYADSLVESLMADRANALQNLRAPLAEAVGHIITIELTTAAIEAQREHEARRRSDRDDPTLREEHRPLLSALKKHDVKSGHYKALKKEHEAAIAKYILRVANEAAAKITPVRDKSQSHEQRASREHLYWKPYGAPNNSAEDERFSRWVPQELDDPK